MGEAWPVSNRRKEKPRTKSFQTNDSFQNFTARLGFGTGNQNDGSRYGFHPVSRNRLQMEWCYRGSFIAGRVVDCVANDMVREGVTVTTTDPPDKISQLDKNAQRLRIWAQLGETIKWARLYGGACAFMMIDGQKPETPLRLDTIQKGQFKGLLPMDRWLLNPSLQDLVTEYGPHFGKPRFYQTTPDTMGMPRLNIHYSRMIRVEGVKLPYWQTTSENLWGQSVLERMWDRLIAFDSTSTGTAQLVYKAHLRTYAVKDLRQIIASGGPALDGLMAQINMIRAVQTNEGMTLMDADDKFETHQYAFSGLDAILACFGEQLAGASEIPLVRLFGQSPKGFSTGDADIRAYYDTIKQQQVAMIGPGVEDLYRVLYISTFGTEPPAVFDIDFKHLWQTSDTDKATITNTTTAAVTTAYEAQIIKRATALKALKALSKITGTFSEIDDSEINEAEADPAPTPEALGLEIPKPPAVKPGDLEGKSPEKPNLRAVN